MSVCFADYDVFSVKEWRDLETGSRGRSKSLKMAPFDRSYRIFYSSAIVSIAVCCTMYVDRFQFVKQSTRNNNILDLVLSTSNKIISNIDILPPIGTSGHNVMIFAVLFIQFFLSYYDE